MSEINGRPTATELLAAVAEFIEGEVRSNTTGAVNFHALVAANVLRMVERELLDDTAAGARDALTTLGYPDETSLANSIRAGDLDGREAQLLATLRALVGRRLDIAHPGYSQT